MEFKDFAKKVLRYNKNSDIGLLEKAYNFSEKKLNNEKRKNGKTRLEHCLDVASILTELNVDDETLAAGLMHGLIGKGIKENEIEKEFGKEITELLTGIDKITILKKSLRSKSFENESLRKVLLAASKDIRIVIIKICDKLANVKELESLSKEEQTRICKEAMEIYAPLAYRLGIGKIKSELEDTAFKYLEPEKYKEVEERVRNKREFGETRIYKVRKILENELNKNLIKFEITGRVKQLYGLYKKTINRGFNLDDITDIVGLRIITENIDECYKSLGIVHKLFRPLPGMVKDYIAMPKPNGYQSLHTTVFDGEEKIIEIQIRTKEMQEFAEEGVAAHFKYKGLKEDKEFDKKLSWLKQLVRKENIENIDVDFFGDNIFVFTPKGKEIELPIEATVLDFAYAVHSDIGDKATAANINGKFSNLKTELQNGDTIEIITAKTQTPSNDWLKIAKTSKARSKIKQSLREHGKIITRNYNAVEEKKEVEEGLIYVEGNKDAKIKLANCCNPMPGDIIMAASSGIKKFTIHKEHCDELKKINKNKTKARWKNPKKSDVEIIIEGVERKGLLNEVLNSVNPIKKVEGTKLKPIGSGLVECSFSINIANIETITQITNKIKKIQGVKKVYLGRFL